jgi:sensor histidine kinase YesM
MNKLIKEFPRATWIVLSIFVLLTLLNFLMGEQIAFNKDLAINLGYTMLFGYSLYYANAILFMKLDDVFVQDRFTKKRLIIGTILSLLITLLVIFLMRIITSLFIENRTLAEFMQSERPANYIFSTIITLFVTLGIHAFYFYKAYQENKVKEQKVIAGTESAQFESLKNQIDPHFLFNSLNVLSSLIEENPENAQKFTTSLSKIYRYVLEQKDKELVSVEEEIAFAKTYMNLLKMRFENSITFELPEVYDVEMKVVPLSLQLLLENCIKHNVVSERKPLHIKISIENNHLVVANNLQKKEVLTDRKGVGLQNIVNRYAILTKRNVEVQESDSFFKVFLPILTKQITTMNTTHKEYSENITYLKAKERVDKLKGFYANLISYCTVIPVLIIINLGTSGFQWFWFPMLGWGMGLTFHALETFGYGKSWEERKIREILDKEEQQKNTWK